MVIFLISLLSWLVIAAFALLPNKLPIMDSIVVFFCVSIFTRSAFSLLGLNWEVIVPSNEMELHVAGLISRLILFPVLLLIFITLFQSGRSPIQRLGTVLLSLASLHFVDWLSLKLKMISFHHWNYFYSFLMFVSFMLVAYGSEKGFTFFTRRERTL